MSISIPFAKGLALGVATAGVAFVAFEAVRRARSASMTAPPERIRIDGARPIDPLLLDVRPAPEGGSGIPKLANEIPEVEPRSQRW